MDHVCSQVRRYTARVTGDSLDELETRALMAATTVFGVNADLIVHQDYTVSDNVRPDEEPGRLRAQICVCEKAAP